MSQLKEVEHLKIPLEEIRVATQNFNDCHCIGEGGYGKVYKGELIISRNLWRVAIKRLNEKNGQGLKEFLTEIKVLSDFKHQNLIRLLGYCDEQDEKIIVYEYAEGGSLDKYLRRSNTTPLTLLTRLKICVDAARGLDFLHNQDVNHEIIIHRDIKSSNILIDEDSVAKVSDLGLSRRHSDLNRSSIVSNPCGTLGYVEPEYKNTSILKKESDVYSFGIVLFEVLCGSLCTNIMVNGLLLSSSSAKDYYVSNSLDKIVDPSLKEEMNLDSMKKFAAVAYGCLHADRGQRPPMGRVVKELEESLELQIRLEKVRRIFQLFDRNEDGGLNKEELEALLVAINFDLKHCSQETISSSTDKVFCLYDKFIDGEKGLTCYGLLRIYDDGDGDLDLDYEKLGLNVKPHSDGGPIFSFRAPGRCEKAWRIFEHFDLNNDGGLNREELEALIVATNYNVRYDHFLNQYEKKYIDGEMGLNVDDFFNRYEKYIDGKKGLTFYGLLLSYDQGDLDLDQISDFLAMMFKLYTKINDQVALGRRIR